MAIPTVTEDVDNDDDVLHSDAELDSVLIVSPDKRRGVLTIPSSSSIQRTRVRADLTSNRSGVAPHAHRHRVRQWKLVTVSGRVLQPGQVSPTPGHTGPAHHRCLS